MEVTSIDPNALYTDYSKLLKSVLNLQAYIVMKHKGSGLLVPFPDLCFPGLFPVKKTRDEIQADDTVFRVFMSVPLEPQFYDYLDFYVQLMCDQTQKIVGKEVKVKVFEKSNGLTWRTYMDLVIEQLSEAISE
jgi:hypothetical protein